MKYLCIKLYNKFIILWLYFRLTSRGLFVDFFSNTTYNSRWKRFLLDTLSKYCRSPNHIKTNNTIMRIDLARSFQSLFQTFLIRRFLLLCRSPSITLARFLNGNNDDRSSFLRLIFLYLQTQIYIIRTQTIPPHTETNRQNSEHRVFST